MREGVFPCNQVLPSILDSKLVQIYLLIMIIERSGRGGSDRPIKSIPLTGISGASININDLENS